jgi:exosortase H (IPTLxxWG-CTERM-specific)
MERKTKATGQSADGRGFLVRFLGLVTLFFLAAAPVPVNRTVIEPFTALLARAGGAVCHALGAGTRTTGTMIQGPTFAVDIRNGCNGLETVFVYAAAVLAFPAPWRLRLLGLIPGVAAIQAVNLVRIVTLFFIGVKWPQLFEKTHVVVWQTLIILFGVSLFLVWASRIGPDARSPRQTDPR